MSTKKLDNENLLYLIIKLIYQEPEEIEQDFPEIYDIFKKTKLANENLLSLIEDKNENYFGLSKEEHVRRTKRFINYLKKVYPETLI